MRTRMITAVLLFTGSIFTSQALANDSKTWIYAEEDGTLSSVTVLDRPNRTGEEMVIWHRVELEETAKPTTINDTNIEAPFFVQDDGGQTLLDVNLGLSFGSSFEQTKAMLNDKSFREAFSYLPAECPTEANGFLIVMDNLSQEMQGFCLIPQ